MSYDFIDHFVWLKGQKKGYFDLSSSGVTGPSSLGELGIELADLPLSGGNDYGYPPLKEWLAVKFGVDVDCIAIVPGASGGNFCVITTITGTGDTVLLETPYYQPFGSVIEAVTGSKPVGFARLPEERYSISVDRVFSKNQKPKLVVASNLHNPTGVLEPFETFVGLAERAAKDNGWVLVDEIFLPFTEEYEWHTAARLHDRIIATGSLTKAWGLSGLRLGWVIGPPEIIKRIEHLLDYTAGVLPVLTEAIALKILENGKADALLSTARQRSAVNRKTTIDWLNDWNEFDFVEPAGGVIMMLRRKDEVSTDSFCQRLLEQEKILVTPGRFFNDPNGIRLGLASDPVEISNALRKFQTVYNDMG